MTRLTATEAARRFADLLDAVESRRESFVIVRRGRPVATIGPASDAAGARLKKVLAEHSPDGAWADELRDLRAGLADDADPWRD